MAACRVSPCNRAPRWWPELLGRGWVSNNMGRMADVMAADLVRLAPHAKPQIEANLAALQATPAQAQRRH